MRAQRARGATASSWCALSAASKATCRSRRCSIAQKVCAQRTALHSSAPDCESWSATPAAGHRAREAVTAHDPWSHTRTRLAEASRGGWVFTAASPDPVVGAKDLREVYDALTGGFRGRCTAPLLVDKVQKKVVSNESADLMRMLNQMTAGAGGKEIELCPADKTRDIGRLPPSSALLC